ncbi:MAG: biotin transporter BioY [Chloroflexi bacterium]|nr:biotin transporter BioY [Chloroflexota bacterium]
MNYIASFETANSIPKKAVQVVIILTASWLIALSAQMAITLPFSPVPISGQTLAVLLTGLMLGKNRGAAAVALYLTQGAAGMPFFAGGKSGLVTLLGPTGGYLIGFVFAAYVVGMLAELRYKKSLVFQATNLLIGNVIIYGFGLFWLARFVGEAQVLQFGLFPFLVGDGLKILVGVLGIGSLNLISLPIFKQDQFS